MSLKASRHSGLVPPSVIQSTSGVVLVGNQVCKLIDLSIRKKSSDLFRPGLEVEVSVHD